MQLLCQKSETCPAGKVLVHKNILEEASALLKEVLSLMLEERDPVDLTRSGPAELKVQ
jgi:hypothetical protein